MRRLEARAITAASFAPFGTLIIAEAKEAELINDGTTRRFPLRIEKLERHLQAAQVFLPLGAHRFVVVVTPGGSAPDWEGVQAFITAPWQGVSLNRGCWHHGLIALADGDRFAVIEGGGYRNDTEEKAAPQALELGAPAAIQASANRS